MHSPQRLAFSTTSLLLALACASDPEGTPNTGSGGVSSGGGGNPGSIVPEGGSATIGGAGAGMSGSGVTVAGAGTGGVASGGTGTGGTGGAVSGGTGNGGTGTGGAGGATGGSAPSGCSGVSAKFCDDFETQTANMPPKGDFSLDFKAGSSTIVVDGSKAFSGKQAIHISAPKPGAQSFLSFSKQFPLNDFHGRAMMYINAIPTAGIHWDVIDTTSNNGVHWEIGGMYGKFIFVVDPPDHGITSNPFPAGKWFCLQWEFKYGDGGDNSFLAKMDGTVLDKGQFTGPDSGGQKWNAGPWKNMLLGWTGYGGSDVDIEEWIDDLAIGDQPIACPAK